MNLLGQNITNPGPNARPAPPQPSPPSTTLTPSQVQGIINQIFNQAYINAIDSLPDPETIGSQSITGGGLPPGPNKSDIFEIEVY